jgi:hypothetical protein
VAADDVPVIGARRAGEGRDHVIGNGAADHEGRSFTTTSTSSKQPQPVAGIEMPGLWVTVKSASVSMSTNQRSRRSRRPAPAPRGPSGAVSGQDGCPTGAPPPFRISGDQTW